jgi:hypothetical protein
MRGRRGYLGLVAACVLAVPPAGAQEVRQIDYELDVAVERARAAWIEHDVQALIVGSDTVRLRIPEVTVSASLQPEQAARLLDGYLDPAQERSFELVGVRRMADDHAYAEIARCYVVKGTEEELGETVFLGFRYLDGAWRLREVRVTP